MGGRAAALLAENDDDQPKSRAAQLLAEPDAPAAAQQNPDAKDMLGKIVGSLGADGLAKLGASVASGNGPVTLDDIGHSKQLEQTGDWYTQHYGTPGAAAKTMGGGAMEMLGSILGFAPEAKAAGVGARMLQQGIAGGLGGAGAGVKDDNSAGDTGLKALLGTVLGAGTTGALGLAGKVSEGASDLTGWLARKADNTKAGSTSKIRDELIEKFGIENGPDMLGQLVRKYSPSSLFSPKTSAGHLGAIKSQLGDEGINLAGMTRQAGEEGADAASAGAMQGAQNDMLGKAAGLDSTAYSDTAAATARNLEGLMNRSASKPLPQDFEGLIGSKAQYGKDAFRKVTGFTDEDAKSEAAKQAWMSMKSGEQQALGAATPDTAARFGDSQKTFGELSSLDESLQPRASADDAVGNAGTAAVGAVAGAMMPGGQGIMGALTSGTNNAVRQMTGGVAHDLFSNVMHPASSGFKTMANGLDAASSAPWGAAATAGIDAASDDDNKSRGYQTNSLLDEAMQQNPRMLGKYQYIAKMEPDERKQEISRLQDDDENFRRLLTNLHSAAASMRQ